MTPQSSWKFFSERLKDLFNKKSLPNLLILSGNNSDVKHWINSEILPHYFKNTGERDQNLLTLGPSGTTYKLEDLLDHEWKSFFSHRPNDVSYRLIILEHCELLSDRVANRLLKDLEDTPAWISIIMIHSGAAKILPTIRSRALLWKMPLTARHQDSADEDEKEFKQWSAQIAECATQKKYAALPELLKADQFNEIKLMEKLHESFLARSEDLNYAHCEKWIEHLRWWQQSKTFHQSKWERLLPFCVFSASGLSDK